MLAVIYNREWFGAVELTVGGSLHGPAAPASIQLHEHTSFCFYFRCSISVFPISGSWSKDWDWKCWSFDRLIRSCQNWIR